MGTQAEQGPLNLDPGFVAAVRERLDAAGFDEAGVLGRLQTPDSVRVDEKSLPRLLRLTAEGTPLDVFIELFLLGTSVPSDAAARAVAPTPLADWCDGGLLAEAAGAVTAPLRMAPQQGFRVVFDPPVNRVAGPPAPDRVPGPGRITMDLLHATVRRPVGRVLDLGTGPGVQGLACSRHAEQVVSTDVNPRALNLAAFNAALNGVEHLEVREGSLFDPVAGERFDLVVVNPPFAISPDSRFVYRDGGTEGDGFVRGLVAEVGAYLEAGGLCQMTAQWAQLRGQPWPERLAGWVEGTGCDAWVIELASQRPEVYAANWIRESERLDEEAYRARWEEWMAYFDAAGIESISTGLITLRRASERPNRFWTLGGVDGLDGSAGGAIERGLAARDRLHGQAPADLARSLRPRIAPGVRLDTVNESDGGGWRTRVGILRQTRGLQAGAELDPSVAQLVGLCDGARSLSDLAAAVTGAEGDALRTAAESLVPVVVGLIERGFLELD